jgi:CoA:oxalate CoA-transferase
MTKNREEWLKEFLEGDVACAPINNIAQAFEDPQINFRKMIVEVDSPYWGKYKTTGMPVKMTQLEQARFESPPRLGEHNEEILERLLGYSKEEMENFKKEGII